MAHDFKRFPELTNGQMQLYYFQSPHKQIFENFRGRVDTVIDGDTIKMEWRERDFVFPVRFANTQAPELSEVGGEKAKSWLEERLEGEEVEIIIDYKNRVGKWGRLIGRVEQGGMDVGEEMKRIGLAGEFI